MTVAELRKLLAEAGVRDDAVSLEGGHPNEGYVLSRSGGVWSVYYSERGLRTSLTTFTSEAEACDDLLRRVLADPTARGYPGS